MAVKTKDALKTQSANTFFDNDLGGIVPAEHRTFNTDLIDSMATSAQGAKADTAIQAATVGGSAISKSGTTLQFPAYATAAQGTKANTAIQAATVGGSAVPKSGTTLQFPAYPITTPIGPNLCTFESMLGATFESKVYWYNIGNALLLSGYFILHNKALGVVRVDNIPASILSRVIQPTEGFISKTNPNDVSNTLVHRAKITTSSNSTLLDINMNDNSVSFSVDYMFGLSLIILLNS